MEPRPFEPLSAKLDRLRRWDPDEARAQHVAYLRDHYRRRRAESDDQFWKDWTPMVSSSGMIDLLPSLGTIERILRDRRKGDGEAAR